MPAIDVSDPGQNIAPERRFWRRTVTQIGSPPHHLESRDVCEVIVKRSGQAGSEKALAMMPWCDGYRPVTIV